MWNDFENYIPFHYEETKSLSIRRIDNVSMVTLCIYGYYGNTYIPL